MTERDRMLAGEPYDPFDPELVAARERARDLCQELNATRESQQQEPRRILRDRGPLMKAKLLQDGPERTFALVFDTGRGCCSLVAIRER